MEQCVLPTGSGKGLIMNARTGEWVQEGKKVLIMMNRIDLVEQNHKRAISDLRDIPECIGSIGKICRGKVEYASGNRVVVAGTQTLTRHLDIFPNDYFDHIIVDECHHVYARTYQQVLGHFPEARISGYTATPATLEEEEFFISYRRDLQWMIDKGYLVPARFYRLGYMVDYHDMKNFKDNPGYIQGVIRSLCSIPDRHNNRGQYIPGPRNRRILAYLPLISIGEEFAGVFNAMGFKAAHVSCNSKKWETKKAIRDFENGNINVICNSMKLTEGIDIPSADCILILRPGMRSSILYRQMIGRGFRLSPKTGKKDMLVVDPTFISEVNDIRNNEIVIKRLRNPDGTEDELIVPEDDYEEPEDDDEIEIIAPGEPLLDENENPVLDEEGNPIMVDPEGNIVPGGGGEETIDLTAQDRLFDALEINKHRFSYDEVVPVIPLEHQKQELKDHLKRVYNFNLDTLAKVTSRWITPLSNDKVLIRTPPGVRANKNLYPGMWRITEKWIAELLSELKIRYHCTETTTYMDKSGSNVDRKTQVLISRLEKKYDYKGIELDWVNRLEAIVNVRKRIIFRKKTKDTSVSHRDVFLDDNTLICTDDNLTILPLGKSG